MTLFPLDSVRNAVPDYALEPLLEQVRDLVATLPERATENSSRADVLCAFDLARPRLNVITSLLHDRPGDTGADISTGLGFLPPLLEMLGMQVLATEHDPNEACMLLTRGQPVHQYSVGARRPAPDGSLDWLVFAEVLEHLKMPATHAIREMARMLRVGGRFVLSTPNIARLSHLQALASGDTFLEPFPDDLAPGVDPTDFLDHVREYSLREVVEAVEACDLAVDTVLVTGWGDAGYAPLANPYANEIIVLAATRYDTDIQ